jgi:hypothetical protein
MLQASQKLLHAGNVDRRGNPPTTDFVNVQPLLQLSMAGASLKQILALEQRTELFRRAIVKIVGCSIINSVVV